MTMLLVSMASCSFSFFVLQEARVRKRMLVSRSMFFFMMFGMLRGQDRAFHVFVSSFRF